MNEIDYSKLSLEDKEDIVKRGCKAQANCGNLTCNECPIHFDNYTNFPAELLKGRKRLGCAVFLAAIREDISNQSGGTVMATGKLSAAMNFTPENTSMEYLVKNDLLVSFCKLFDPDAVQDICEKSSCSKCNLHQDHFSIDWKIDNGMCTSLLSQIHTFGMLYERVIEVQAQPNRKMPVGNCKGCKYRKTVGEFIYCTAWKNFTTDDMSCGYYLTADSENDIISE